MVEMILMSEEEINLLEPEELVAKADSLFNEYMHFLPGIPGVTMDEPAVIGLVCKLYQKALDKGTPKDEYIGKRVEGIHDHSLGSKLDEANVLREGHECTCEEPPEYSLQGGEHLKEISALLTPLYTGLVGIFDLSGEGAAEKEGMVREALELGREALKAGFPEEGRWFLDEEMDEAISRLPHYDERIRLREEFGLDPEPEPKPAPPRQDGFGLLSLR